MKERFLYLLIIPLLAFAWIYQRPSIDLDWEALSGKQLLEERSFAPPDNIAWSLKGEHIPVKHPLKAILAFKLGHTFELLLLIANVLLIIELCRTLELSSLSALIGALTFQILSSSSISNLDFHLGAFSVLILFILFARSVNPVFIFILSAIAANLTRCSLGLPLVLLAFLPGKVAPKLREYVLSYSAAALIGLLLSPYPLAAFETRILSPDLHGFKLLLIALFAIPICIWFGHISIPEPWRRCFILSIALFLLNGDYAPYFFVSLTLVIIFALQKFFTLSQISNYRITTVGIFVAAVLFGSFAATAESPLNGQALSEIKGKRVLNNPDVAINLVKAGVQPFIDPRSEVFSNESKISVGREVFRDYGTLRDLGDNWAELLEERKFEAAVLPRRSSLAQALQELKGWGIKSTLGTKIRKTPREDLLDEYLLLTPPAVVQGTPQT